MFASRCQWIFLFVMYFFQAVCGEVEQSERMKEKIQEDVNKLKQQIALRKHKTAEEERSMYFFYWFYIY